VELEVLSSFRFGRAGRPAGYDAVAGGQHIWIWRAKYSSSLKETAD
jgi:hypothetical protein